MHRHSGHLAIQSIGIYDISQNPLTIFKIFNDAIDSLINGGLRGSYSKPLGMQYLTSLGDSPSFVIILATVYLPLTHIRRMRMRTYGVHLTRDPLNSSVHRY